MRGSAETRYAKKASRDAERRSGGRGSVGRWMERSIGRERALRGVAKQRRSGVAAEGAGVGGEAAGAKVLAEKVALAGDEGEGGLEAVGGALVRDELEEVDLGVVEGLPVSAIAGARGAVEAAGGGAGSGGDLAEVLGGVPRELAEGGGREGLVGVGVGSAEVAAERRGHDAMRDDVVEGGRVGDVEEAGEVPGVEYLVRFGVEDVGDVAPAGVSQEALLGVVDRREAESARLEDLRPEDVEEVEARLVAQEVLVELRRDADRDLPEVRRERLVCQVQKDPPRLEGRVSRVPARRRVERHQGDRVLAGPPARAVRRLAAQPREHLRPEPRGPEQPPLVPRQVLHVHVEHVHRLVQPGPPEHGVRGPFHVPLAPRQSRRRNLVSQERRAPTEVPRAVRLPGLRALVEPRERAVAPHHRL
eukprot:CAMPEP_0197406282 /NCGR_PEP_ID=MMETSP1165-20131217/25586_1 /TAXON_ID=284809 /ORGANISM="Chrysocystis fragilis, Strain CCMP3189" /LENGTH=417 /DNA_ID=CAMNT_0042932629 /DNA_START=84 /DNA_END=1334 /DNA_ORIENTATION=-